jgi:imidazole glycerol phosphate synthase subunit HisF
LIAPIFCWHGKAYQTTSYFNYRPLGEVSGLLEIFDRHFVDEILLSCRTDGCGPDIGVLSRLKQSKMATPVCYAGGIIGEHDVVLALEAGADRVGINSILFRREQAEKVISQIGVQGVIAVLPFRIEGGRVEVFDSAARTFRQLEAELIAWLRAVGVEVLLHDVVADGLRLPFNRTVMDSFHDLDLILTGGVRCLDIEGDLTRIKGLGFENILTWSEHAALHIRAATPLLNKRGLV